MKLLIFICMIYAWCVNLGYSLAPAPRLMQEEQVLYETQLRDALKTNFDLFVFDLEALLSEEGALKEGTVLPKAIWQILILLMQEEKTVIIVPTEKSKMNFLSLYHGLMHYLNTEEVFVKDPRSVLKKRQLLLEEKHRLLQFFCLGFNQGQSFVWGDQLLSHQQDLGGLESEISYLGRNQPLKEVLRAAFPGKQPVRFYSGYRGVEKSDNEAALFVGPALVSHEGAIPISKTMSVRDHSYGLATLYTIHQWLLRHYPERRLPSLLADYIQKHLPLDVIQDHLGKFDEESFKVLNIKFVGAGSEKVVYKMKVEFTQKGYRKEVNLRVAFLKEEPSAKRLQAYAQTMKEEHFYQRAMAAHYWNFKYVFPQVTFALGAFQEGELLYQGRGGAAAVSSIELARLYGNVFAWQMIVSPVKKCLYGTKYNDLRDNNIVRGEGQVLYLIDIPFYLPGRGKADEVGLFKLGEGIPQREVSPEFNGKYKPAQNSEGDLVIEAIEGGEGIPFYSFWTLEEMLIFVFETTGHDASVMQALFEGLFRGLYWGMKAQQLYVILQQLEQETIAIQNQQSWMGLHKAFWKALKQVSQENEYMRGYHDKINLETLLAVNTDVPDVEFSAAIYGTLVDKAA